MSGLREQPEPRLTLVPELIRPLARRCDCEHVCDCTQEHAVVRAERVRVRALRRDDGDELLRAADRDRDLPLRDHRFLRLRRRLAQRDLLHREAVRRRGERLGEELRQARLGQRQAPELGDERLLPLAAAQLLDRIQLFHAHGALMVPHAVGTPLYETFTEPSARGGLPSDLHGCTHSNREAKGMRSFALASVCILALVGAGVAVGKSLDGNNKSAKSVAGTFTATTASKVETRTCTTTDGKTLVSSTGTYTGTATGDPDLTGPATLSAHALINSTDNLGSVSGTLKVAVSSSADTTARYNAVYSGGSLAGLATGHAQDEHTKLLANLSAGFSAAGGFTNGKIGGTSGGGAVELGPGEWKSSHGDHGQARDTPLDHQPRHLGERLAGRDRGHLARHHVLDQHRHALILRGRASRAIGRGADLACGELRRKRYFGCGTIRM